MKKIGILLVCIFLITGCSSEGGKTICVNETTLDEGITLSSTYIIYTSGDNVSLLETAEMVEVEKEEDLEEYKKTLESVYAVYNEVPYYNNKIFIDDNKLTSITYIDYDRISTKKLISIDSNNEALIKDGKVNVEDLINMYEEAGAVCK